MADSFDRVAARYDATRAIPAAAEAAIAAGIARAVSSTPQTRLLEIGVGTGRIALPLARQGLRCIGIDRSAPMLVAAQRKGRAGSGRLLLARADATALPFATASVDIALSPCLPPDPRLAPRPARGAARPPSGRLHRLRQRAQWRGERRAPDQRAVVGAPDRTRHHPAQSPLDRRGGPHGVARSRPRPEDGDSGDPGRGNHRGADTCPPREPRVQPLLGYPRPDLRRGQRRACHLGRHGVPCNGASTGHPIGVHAHNCAFMTMSIYNRLTT